MVEGSFNSPTENVSIDFRSTQKLVNKVEDDKCVILCKSYCSIQSLVMIIRGLGKSTALRRAMIEERNLNLKDHRRILRKV